MQKRFDIYTDGSCSGNGRPDAEGGWAFVMTPEYSQEIVVGSESMGKVRTNMIQNSNRAELEAVCQALEWLDRHIQPHCRYTVFCDSTLIVNGVTGKGSRSSNRDLWEPIEELCRKHRKQLEFENVSAHEEESTDIRCIMNNYVDVLARQAARSLLTIPVSA